MKKLILSTLTLLSLQSMAGQGYITVGAESDDQCNFHTIQEAIDSELFGPIRIASNKNYFESLIISNESKELIGGYANCAQAGDNITDLSKAIITGGGNMSVIEVNKSNDNDIDEVYLKNLIVANGTNGIRIDSQNNGELIVKIDDVRTFNNNEHGLDVTTLTNATASVSLKDTLVDFNQDSGIYCSGLAAKIRIGGDSIIENNEAIGSGGGLYVRNTCHVDIYSPTIIRDNKAQFSGGGLYVSFEASVDILGFGTNCENDVCLGESQSFVTFDGNIAESDQNQTGFGGAISAVGESVNIDVSNALITNNKSKFGSAFSVSVGAKLLMLGYESPGDECWSSGSCSQVTGNSAEGGAIHVDGEGSSALFSAVKFYDNVSSSTVIGLLGGNAKLGIFNSLIVNNGDDIDPLKNDKLFQINGSMAFPDTLLELDGVTIADNKVNQVVFRNNGANINVASSLIFDGQDVYLESGDSPNSHFECVIAHENMSFSAGGTVSVVDRLIQPVFVNSASSNYHLRVDSPAIDYCYETELNGGSDMDYDERGSDYLGVDNLHGVYDIGADEFHISNDIIFKNGLELD